ncbi:hypothetical protein [Capnocytophaga felis]|uniref:Tetratricopeptide repeat protein n=1 Tax=Capnocytophaga felis TaxID=2267611 RepID=A0A5M4BB14_9FLAO|nr:hypothetical protein [Capnocytophaga felis]GET46771.1 hypothetical protein RCZ01_20730 [Capnocytophaga felis]GET48473.1 hypothetical protein RCZ02_13040 [Capnocytophaga felis]
MNKSTFVTLLIIGVGAFLYFYNSEKASPIDLVNYQPTQEFAPAYNILKEESKISEERKGEKEYDIEETVRIMNGLELAQSQSDNFYDFLEYLAKQDYSLVAQDVIEAKMKLLPILQKMFELEKKHQEISFMWELAKNMATTPSSNSAISDLVMNVSPAKAHLQLLSAAKAVGTQAIDTYQKQQELKSALEDEINVVKNAYIEYLSEFSPIYYKYMKEWDLLCVNKDKAYLEVYSGRMEEARNSTSDILKKYPNNREALLLKALALINIPPKIKTIENQEKIESISQDEVLPIVQEEVNENFIEAEATLNTYIELYPERSAPALVLKGLLSAKEGKVQQSLSYYDQAAIEYPRQAIMLTDLLDSYRNRTYLNKTPEGQYLLRLYRSTMEGYGIFSPNFLKANYYVEKGMLEESKNEIFNHFFRRGNQGIYDCLLSDMNYCEDNLYSSFKQLLMEQSFIDVGVNPASDWKFLDKEDEILVTINNRSDIKLENVRLFLCLHYTDMYKDEYDVIKTSAKNIINPHEQIELAPIKLEYNGKKYNDITRVRVIAMTDDKICWVDDAEYKQNHALNISNNLQYAKNRIVNEKREVFLKDFSLTADKLKTILEESIGIQGGQKKSNSSVSWYSWDGVKEVGSSISSLWKESDKKLKIELPRILTLIDPIFSIYELQDKDRVILPKENYLAGSNIRLKFDNEPKEGEIIPLYIYSDFVNFKINLIFKGNNPIVKNVEIL